MKKTFYSLVAALFVSLMVACGNAEVEKINQLIIDATEQTQAAQSAQEVGAIASELKAEMEKIEAEAGDKLTLGKNVDESLAKYQETAAKKLAEFGIEMQ